MTNINEKIENIDDIIEILNSGECKIFIGYYINLGLQLSEGYKKYPEILIFYNKNLFTLSIIYNTKDYYLTVLQHIKQNLNHLLGFEANVINCKGNYHTIFYFAEDYLKTNIINIFY